MLKIKNIYDFKDILICALRYALGRRTYIPKVVADFIKEYPEVIDSRVKMVMLKDIDEYFDCRGTYYNDDEYDYETWLDLKEWLELDKLKELKEEK